MFRIRVFFLTATLTLVLSESHAPAGKKAFRAGAFSMNINPQKYPDRAKEPVVQSNYPVCLR